MVKRKGGEFAESPTTAFVTTIASPHTMTSSSTASVSSIFPLSTSSFTWEETSQVMAQLLEHYVGSAASDNISLVKESTSLNKDASEWKNSCLLESQSIQSRIQSRINECHVKYQQEDGALEKQRQHLVTLEGEEHHLREKNAQLRKEKGEIEQKIDKYRMEASQEVEKIDEWR